MEERTPMRNAEQMALVVKLACETADRAVAEQQALMAVAASVDLDLASAVGKTRFMNGKIVMDPDKPLPIRPWLFEYAVASYEPDGRRAAIPRPLASRMKRATERFDKEVQPCIDALQS
jgi:hypothetical protein